jgi:ribosomal peptide maturation radical SAM protein 1
LISNLMSASLTPAAGAVNSRVVFVAMPWATAVQPSIQLGILTARCRDAGIPAQGLYANLHFAELVGGARYETYGTYDSLFAQWVFTEMLFGPNRGDTFLSHARSAGVTDDDLDELLRVKSLTTRLLAWCVEKVDWRSVEVVGFTTTLLQTLPSLAMARQLKEQFPHLIVLMGGAGCHGVMGRAVHRNFPFVQGVVDGEADGIIVPLLADLLNGQKPSVPGLIWRSREAVSAMSPAIAHRDMSDYPVPDYTDFFREPASRAMRPRIPFEASRGCWWAERSQCKFCGLNAEFLQQRVRPLQKVADELKEQHRRHRALFFVGMDNIIAPTHITNLPAALRQVPGAEVFFEVRPVMRRRHFSELAKSGVVHMQPGIESLVPEVLDLVDKGTSPLDNVCFLRRASEFGVRAYWNLLYGFPGEERQWYDRMLSELPLLSHLQPPDVIRFSLQRFSPFFDEPERYGIQVRGPIESSRHVWLLPDEEIQELSFDLAFELPQRWDTESLGDELRNAVAAWKTTPRILTAYLGERECVIVQDDRPGFPRNARLPQAASRLLRRLEAPAMVHPEDVDAVTLLQRSGLIYGVKDRYVALVIPRESEFWTNSA